MRPKQFASDKILDPEHRGKLDDWFDGKNPFVITMEIDPTNVCNHNCPGCVGWPERDAASLTRTEMCMAIEEAKTLGGKGITFTGGGEPLCNPATQDAIAFAREIGLDVALITNGSLLHKTDMGRLVRDCTWIRVSLDAGKPEMHVRTHGTKNFWKVMLNIEYLVQAKRKAELQCTIGIGYLTGRGTDGFDDMMDFAELAVKLRIDYAQFRPYLSVAREDLHRFRPIDWGPFEEMANDITDILCSKHKYDCMMDGDVTRGYGKCHGHQFATTLCANGDLTICCHTRGMPWATLGNIKENTLKEIWNSERRKKAVEAIDLERCPLLCRCNTFNEILWQMEQPKEHVNFL